MKKFSIITSILLILASFFYGLFIISNDNKCTSVRRYSPECKNQIVTQNVVAPVANITSTSSTNSPTTVANPNQEVTLDYALVSYVLINTSSYFVGGYDTGFDKIIDKGLFYEVVYSGKDSVVVDIAKDKNKIMSVMINGISMSADDIKAIFSKYY